MEQALWEFLFGLLSSALAALIGAVVANAKIRREKKNRETGKQRDWERCLMLLMRSDLIRLHDQFMKKGYCPTSIKLSIREEYDGYHALGGNGVVTQLMEELMALPNEKEEIR